MATTLIDRGMLYFCCNKLNVHIETTATIRFLYLVLTYRYQVFLPPAVPEAITLPVGSAPPIASHLIDTDTRQMRSDTGRSGTGYPRY
jgi:hypothetical protein